jgi:hypothetical protein
MNIQGNENGRHQLYYILLYFIVLPEVRVLVINNKHVKLSWCWFFILYIIYIFSNQCIVTRVMLFILWQVDPLLGDCTAAVARQRPAIRNRGVVFFAVG